MLGMSQGRFRTLIGGGRFQTSRMFATLSDDGNLGHIDNTRDNQTL